MSQITGRVDYLDGPNDYGFYSIKVNGTKYGLGKSAPPFAKGDTVTFDSYQKGKYWQVKGNVEKVSAQSAPSASTGSSSVQSTGKTEYELRQEYWANKEKRDIEVVEPRITFLAAYERATSFVDLAIRAGAFKALEKAKDTEKFGVLEALVLEQTAKIVTASNTKHGTGRVVSIAESEAEGKKDLDDSEEEWS